MRGLSRQQLAAMAGHWHRAPRRWGHSLHSICSYMAMFPPAVPHVFVQWLTEPGDVVYDPFCGRGTTCFEACLAGRIGYGSDANPLAWLLTVAKVDPPTRAAVAKRLAQLRFDIEPASLAEEPPSIRLIFDPETLAQLVWLKRELRLTSKVDRFLLAMLAGMLHANANRDGTPRGLSLAMPNTFAMAPGYVSRYVHQHKLIAPRVDVLSKLAERVASRPSAPSSFRRGSAWVQDAASKPRKALRDSPAKLVFTSPPYLEVMKYGKLNWIRLWLLGAAPKVVDSSLFSSASLDKYLAFMTLVLEHCRAAVQDDGYVCLVLGDVRRGDDEVDLAGAVAEVAVPHSGLRVVGTIVDKVPVGHKVSRIWGERRGRAIKTDRILVLRGPHASRPARFDANSLGWRREADPS